VIANSLFEHVRRCDSWDVCAQLFRFSTFFISCGLGWVEPFALVGDSAKIIFSLRYARRLHWRNVKFSKCIAVKHPVPAQTRYGESAGATPLT
jgi:hypothetical protein